MKTSTSKSLLRINRKRIRNRAMKKLELKHLVPYLPYGLKVQINDKNNNLLLTYRVVIALSNESVTYEFFKNGALDRLPFNKVKPILRPLSDLTKDELKNAEFDYQIDWLTHERDSLVKFYGSLEKFINKTDFGHVQYLISKHYDVFGLIEQGLAIDINTLNQEL